MKLRSSFLWTKAPRHCVIDARSFEVFDSWITLRYLETSATNHCDIAPFSVKAETSKIAFFFFLDFVHVQTFLKLTEYFWNWVSCLSSADKVGKHLLAVSFRKSQSKQWIWDYRFLKNSPNSKFGPPPSATSNLPELRRKLEEYRRRMSIWKPLLRRRQQFCFN